MYAYVARQAIFDRDKKVIGYELLFRNGQDNCFPNIDADEATSKLLNQHHLTHDLGEITDHKLAFINFYRDTLLYRFPTSLDPLNCIIEIVETVEVDDALIKACKHIHDLGFRLALDDYDFNPKWSALFPYIQVVKVEAEAQTTERLAEIMPQLKSAGVKVVVERIETVAQFQHYLDLGVDYFQGFFFTRPEMIQKRQLPASKINLLQLMAISCQTDFDMTEVNRVLERDASLAYKLLRFINNPANYHRQKIASLLHALNYMGQIEVKKFIALLALANLGDDKPQELLRLSLTRARLCELVSRARGDHQNPPKGFLIGLFSLLDAILDLPINVVISKTPIDDEIQVGLIEQHGHLADYVAVCRTLEQADWDRLDGLCQQLGLTAQQIADFHLEALNWANDISKTAFENS